MRAVLGMHSQVQGNPSLELCAKCVCVCVSVSACVWVLTEVQGVRSQTGESEEYQRKTPNCVEKAHF